MMRDLFDRRSVIAGSGAFGLAMASPVAAEPRRDLRIILLGQSLIQQDLRTLGWPAMAAIRRRLAGADVVFTDLETAIEGPLAGAPTRDTEVLHHAPPAVIDCLRGIGVTMVTTANNHAWDLNTGGILSAIDALDQRRVTHAGSGADLAAASAAAIQRTSRGDVALVAAAAGAIREGAAATPVRPGVAELRRLPSGALDT
ncbi:MAG TPA: CapA family protein, partial [Sphingomicrobium sp.]